MPLKYIFPVQKLENSHNISFLGMSIIDVIITLHEK